EWYLEKVLDRWGNQAIYDYIVVSWPRNPFDPACLNPLSLTCQRDNVDLLAHGIEYSSNPGTCTGCSPISAHARVDLGWTSLESRTASAARIQIRREVIRPHQDSSFRSVRLSITEVANVISGGSTGWTGSRRTCGTTPARPGQALTSRTRGRSVTTRAQPS